MEVPEGRAKLNFRGGWYSHYYADVYLGVKHWSHYCSSMRELLLHELPRWLHGTFRPESVKVKSGVRRLTATEQRCLTIVALCEAFGTEPPPAEESTRKKTARKARTEPS